MTSIPRARSFDSHHGLWPWARSGFRPTGGRRGTTGSARGAPYLALLGGAVVLAVAVRLVKPRGRAPQPPPKPAPVATTPLIAAPPAAPPTAQPAAVPAEDMPGLRQGQREQAARWTWSRDPFTRGPAVVGVAGLTLTGIIWDRTSPLAIINGEVLQPGQEIEGYRLLQIQPDRVWLSDGEQLFQLLLSP